MAQLNEKEMQLAALISEGCNTPGGLTTKPKGLFSEALKKCLKLKWMNAWAMKSTAFRETIAVTAVTVRQKYHKKRMG